MDHRTIQATASIMAFLASQPGEFTAQEIRRMAGTFHCDNDEDEVETIATGLAQMGFINMVNHFGYTAFFRKAAQ